MLTNLEVLHTNILFSNLMTDIDLTSFFEVEFLPRQNHQIYLIGNERYL